MIAAVAASLRGRLEVDEYADLSTLRTTADKALSIGSDVWRLRWRNQVTTAVGADASLHTTCGALLDAFAILESIPDADADRSTVNVLIDRPLPSGAGSETDQAIRSMRDASKLVTARIWYHRDATSWADDAALAPSWPADHHRVRRWVSDLLVPRLTTPPHPFALAFLERVDDPSLHLYPSEITAKATNVWAMRADGLEIGTIRPDRAILTIGKPGSNGDGPQRREFTNVFGQSSVTVANDASVAVPGQISLDDAAAKIRELLGRFRDADVRGAPLTHRIKNGVGIVDEHALEARLLKGIVKLDEPAAGLVLDDEVVARGSQFPTLWGIDSRPRYLDALLRRGDSPVAVELKVATGGQGRYYRHSLIQAVLYRHFISQAPGLDPWFEAARLDRTRTQAAIAVPLPARWTDRYATAHDLLRTLAAHVGAEVHLLDDRTTPEQSNDTLSEPSLDHAEQLSWQLAAALQRKWPTALGRIVEVHDGGGQYDQLCLQPVTDRSIGTPSPQARIFLNRPGSARVFSVKGGERWVWRNLWNQLAAGGDIDHAAAALGATAGLGQPTEPTGQSFAEMAAEFLDRIGSHGWSWRCAWFDGKLQPAHWVEPFAKPLHRYQHSAAGAALPTIARIWGAVHDDHAPLIIDQDNLRTWVLVDNGCSEVKDPLPIQRIRHAAELLQRP
ncbi:MAG: hypothetical protein ABJH68_15480 [Ilumatobacter sp.]|uniref:TY-Chap2 family putative peptide chaperone n=1 Tax=Ilumatobacter sp. TaxID=1967498 RepID=UPI0032981224